MLLDEIKEIVNTMTDHATDLRLDYRYGHASLLDTYSSKIKVVLVRHMAEDIELDGKNE